MDEIEVHSLLSILETPVALARDFSPCWPWVIVTTSSGWYAFNVESFERKPVRTQYRMALLDTGI